MSTLLHETLFIDHRIQSFISRILFSIPIPISIGLYKHIPILIGLYTPIPILIGLYKHIPISIGLYKPIAILTNFKHTESCHSILNSKEGNLLEFTK